MSERKLALLGYGRMGKAIEALAHNSEWQISAVIDAGHDRQALERALSDASVAIEFTEPSSAAGNIRIAAEMGCPLVVGTTGWQHELEHLSAYVVGQGSRMLWSPNFSIGALVTMRVAANAAGLVSHLGVFDAHIVETHHTAKKDVPSGTAIAMAAEAEAAMGRTIPVTSVRVGHVPGRHELILDAPFETIHIVHEVRDRRVFAAGALTAAAWLLGQPDGTVYTMSDMVKTGKENQ